MTEFFISEITWKYIFQSLSPYYVLRNWRENPVMSRCFTYRKLRTDSRVWQVFWLVPFSEAFPFAIWRTVAGFSETSVVILTRHHSSGYCYGFKPYSLFIALKFMRHQNYANIELIIITELQLHDNRYEQMLIKRVGSPPHLPLTWRIKLRALWLWKGSAGLSYYQFRCQAYLTFVFAFPGIFNFRPYHMSNFQSLNIL